MIRFAHGNDAVCVYGPQFCRAVSLHMAAVGAVGSMHREAQLLGEDSVAFLRPLSLQTCTHTADHRLHTVYTHTYTPLCISHTAAAPW